MKNNNKIIDKEENKNVDAEKKSDFLDEIETEWTAKNPNFPQLVKEAERKQNR